MPGLAVDAITVCSVVIIDFHMTFFSPAVFMY